MTLAEVLVSSTIGAIIAGMILTVLTVSMSTISTGTAVARMLGHSRVVESLLEEAVRGGNLVLKPGEAWSSTPGHYGPTAFNEIRVYDESGNLTKAFMISGTNFKQSNDGTTWLNVVIGTYAITVEAGSGFLLTDFRRSIVPNLTLTSTYKGATHTLPLQGGILQCRN